MKKLASLVLASAMAVVPFAAGLAATFTPGEYEATAQGFAGAVTVKVTVDEEKVTAVTVTGENETPALGGAAIEGYNASLIDVHRHREGLQRPGRSGRDLLRQRRDRHRGRREQGNRPCRQRGLRAGHRGYPRGERHGCGRRFRRDLLQQRDPQRGERRGGAGGLHQHGRL